MYQMELSTSEAVILKAITNSISPLPLSRSFKLVSPFCNHGMTIWRERRERERVCVILLAPLYMETLWFKRRLCKTVFGSLLYIRSLGGCLLWKVHQNVTEMMCLLYVSISNTVQYILCKVCCSAVATTRSIIAPHSFIHDMSL